MKSKLFTITIKGARWRYRILAKDVFHKIHPEDPDCVAMCMCSNRRMDFTPKAIDEETVLHELGHAYKTETSTESADLTASQLEEVMVDIFAAHGRLMIKQSEKMIPKLKEALKQFPKEKK